MEIVLDNLMRYEFLKLLIPLKVIGILDLNDLRWSVKL